MRTLTQASALVNGRRSGVHIRSRWHFHRLNTGPQVRLPAGGGLWRFLAGLALYVVVGFTLVLVSTPAIGGLRVRDLDLAGLVAPDDPTLVNNVPRLPEWALLYQVNDLRQAAGLRPLVFDRDLLGLARQDALLVYREGVRPVNAPLSRPRLILADIGLSDEIARATASFYVILTTDTALATVWFSGIERNGAGFLDAVNNPAFTHLAVAAVGMPGERVGLVALFRVQP